MEQKIKSQVSRIEEWLLSGKPLTAMMAVQLFSCMNLPQVIARLRRGGMPIDKRRERNSEGRIHTLYYMNTNDKYSTP